MITMVDFTFMGDLFMLTERQTTENYEMKKSCRRWDSNLQPSDYNMM